MAGIKRKHRASTLIETLVAMTLLVTAITLSFLSITGIRRTFKNDLKTYAFFTVNRYLEESDSLDSENDVINYPSFNLLINKERFNGNPFLSMITITAVTRDSVILYELKEVRKVEIAGNSKAYDDKY